MEMTTLDRLPALGFSPFFERQLQTSDDVNRIARIAAEHRGAYEIWSPTGVWAAKLAGRARHDDSSACGVGDWVVLRDEPAPDDIAIIDRLLERRTLFTRGAAGRDARTQIVAANVDLVFAVTGLDADFNVRRIERYLARIFASGAEAAIVLNKADLCDDTTTRLIEVERHARNVPILVTSAVTGQGIGALRAMIEDGRTVAFAGSSGAGKSTLINALLGESRMTTGAVRDTDGRGRHTTTHRQMLVLPGGGVVLDTPGMRELQLLDQDGLEQVFDDIDILASQCRFRDCAHEDEPGCAIVAAAATNPLLAERLAHYRKLRREAQSNELRHDVRLKRKAERMWGQMSDEVRQMRRWKGKP